jgi:TPR repeat protein
MHYFLVFTFVFCSLPCFSAGNETSDLSYESYIDSDKRIKCMYGYAAEKTGNHTAAISIFEDCIRRWNDVYSMIWLSQIYESGSGVAKSLEYATELMRQGAMEDDEAGYSQIARYHYGVALYEGKGVVQNKNAGIQWLRRASNEGLEDARIYIKKIGLQP